MKLKGFGRLCDWLGFLSAWLFFLTGALLTYEVMARYVFTSPTIWAAEISQVLLIWGVFLAIPRTILRHENISIEVLHELLPGWARRLCDGIALLFMLFFCTVVLRYGWVIAWDSFERGRSTGTMLNIPNWWIEVVIPLGFFFSVLACLVGLVRLASGEESADEVC